MQNAPGWLLPAVGLVFTAVHALLSWRRAKPSDAERASLLTQLASEAAAFVVAAFPNASWSELVAAIIKQLAGTPGLPTNSAPAIEKAATAALVRLKGVPAGGK